MNSDLTVFYFGVMAIFFPALVEPRNISNQLSNVWPLLAVAIGQTFVIIIAGIDLSFGATMGFASVAGAIVMTGAADKLLLGGSPVWGSLLDETGGVLAGHPAAAAAGIAVMLITGLVIGLLNGLFIARYRIPAFMMTLVSLMLFSSAAIWITQSLFTNLSIAENIFIGGFPQQWRLIDRAQLRTKASALLADVNLDASPDTLVEHLSPGERQLVEVAKALRMDAGLFIFDEPTTIGQLAADGSGVLLISSEIEEVMAMCDRILRRRAFSGSTRLPISSSRLRSSASSRSA